MENILKILQQASIESSTEAEQPETLSVMEPTSDNEQRVSGNASLSVLKPSSESSSNIPST